MARSFSRSPQRFRGVQANCLLRKASATLTERRSESELSKTSRSLLLFLLFRLFYYQWATLLNTECPTRPLMTQLLLSGPPRYRFMRTKPIHLGSKKDHLSRHRLLYDDGGITQLFHPRGSYHTKSCCKPVSVLHLHLALSVSTTFPKDYSPMLRSRCQDCMMIFHIFKTAWGEVKAKGKIGSLLEGVAC